MFDFLQCPLNHSTTQNTSFKDTSTKNRLIIHVTLLLVWRELSKQETSLWNFDSIVQKPRAMLSVFFSLQICIVREHSEIDGAIEYVLGCEKRVVSKPFPLKAKERGTKPNVACLCRHFDRARVIISMFFEPLTIRRRYMYTWMSETDFKFYKIRF